MNELFKLEEVVKAQAVVWMSPTHPLGRDAATAARRRLPDTIPLLCMADPLGLTLRGRYAIDLIHVISPKPAVTWSITWRRTDLTAPRAGETLRHRRLLARAGLPRLRGGGCSIRP